MHWTFERRFYGTAQGLDLESCALFLCQGYYPLPRTLLKGRFRGVVRVGDHDRVYERIERPFPDALLAQRPDGPFALHLSGGFDSAILAKLYDRPDADYVHFRGPETAKARALADTLQGTLHEVEVTPRMFVEAARELVGRLPEPYRFEDVVYAYLASREAAALGHDLVVVGDGGDGLFGGAVFPPESTEASMIWKSVDPNTLLGLHTLQPYMHQALQDWARTCLAPEERGFDKRLAARFCRDLGMPRVVSEQGKGFWAGAHGTRTSRTVLQHMESAIEASGYGSLRRLRLPSKPLVDFTFRLYGLVEWLRTHHVDRPGRAEVRALEGAVRRFRPGRSPGARLKQLVPPAARPLARAAGRAIGLRR